MATDEELAKLYPDLSLQQARKVEEAAQAWAESVRKERDEGKAPDPHSLAKAFNKLMGLPPTRPQEEEPPGQKK